MSSRQREEIADGREPIAAALLVRVHLRLSVATPKSGIGVIGVIGGEEDAVSLRSQYHFVCRIASFVHPAICVICGICGFDSKSRY